MGTFPRRAAGVIARRLDALDGLQTLDDLERAQLEEARQALMARPQPSLLERVRNQMVRFLDPEDALLWHLCEGLELADQQRMTGHWPTARNRLVDCLDRIATILGRELPLARLSGDSFTDRQYHQRVREVADAFRSLKIDVLLPNPEGVNRVVTALIQALLALAGDNWRLMPGDPAPPPPTPPPAVPTPSAS